MQINLQFSEREYLRGEASEIRLSEQKTKIFLSFSEREYLRGEASEIRLSEQKTKFLFGISLDLHYLCTQNQMPRRFL